MPKRIIKSKRDFNSGFAHGFSAGKQQVLLAMQFSELRKKKAMSIEEFAKGANVPEWFIQGMEDIDYLTFLKADISRKSKTVAVKSARCKAQYNVAHFYF